MKESEPDKLEIFRKIKTPLWARWLGWYRSWRERRRALTRVTYVTTYYAWTWFNDSKYFGRAWYICNVRGDGKRYYEYGAGNDLVGGPKSHPAYANSIAPWLLGALTHEQLRERARQSWDEPAVPNNG